MIPPELRKRIIVNMLESRCLDERLIRCQKQGLGYFWTGGPGEEAFNSCLGALLRVGRGPDYDFLLPHYRSSAIALMTGERTIDFLRQMLMRQTDPFSRGRNFANHFCNAAHNLGPVSSPVNSQFVFALGTSRAQLGREGITVVIGGDASTHQGDFASLLVWSTRPRENLPILCVVTNNRIGLSTPYETQHAYTSISQRVAGYGIKSVKIDGLDIDESYQALRQAFEFVRRERKPYFIEAEVSRLYGHSSASGAGLDPNSDDPLLRIDYPQGLKSQIEERLRDELRQVLNEPLVESSSAELFQFAQTPPWPPSLRQFD